MAKKADWRLQASMIKEASEVFGVILPGHLNTYEGRAIACGLVSCQFVILSDRREQRISLLASNIWQPETRLLRRRVYPELVEGLLAMTLRLLPLV